MKRDAYLDILEIVAYHGVLTRRNALGVLATFWPKALGHIVIGKPLPIISYTDILSAQTSSKLRFSRPGRDHPYTHEFMPWRFSHADSSSLDYGVLRSCCQSCSSPIIGFGLLCPFCCVCVHLNCYDSSDGTFHGQYHSPSETDPRPYFLSFSYILPSRKDSEPKIINKADHGFRLVNLFTLALCLVCRKPLWGHAAQGLKCTRCHQSVHSSCIVADLDVFPRCDESSLTSDNVLIDWSIMRQTFVNHYRHVLMPEEDLSRRSYEEISIYYSILWAQLRILDNGVSYRSIIVNQESPRTALAKESIVDEFELQYFVKLYEAYLSSGRLALSTALQEYLDFNKLARSNEHSILFDWSLLSSITSFLKTPLSAHPASLSSSSNLLHVDQEIAAPVDALSHPYEIVTLTHMRNALGHEFQVHLDGAARYMLSHIHQIGFVDRIDASSELYDGTASSDVFCSFPLPTGLDLSTSVETLVVAIDACLRDIDIAINEYGFLLLVRRFASIGAASDYALSRLTKIVLSWIFAEDDRLVVVARDYVARNASLPGVRAASEPPPWPFTSTSRYNTKTTVNSGGEYVSCRKQLLTRHAIPWLASVHELDITLYTNYLYDHCVDVAEASQSVASSLSFLSAESKMEMVSITFNCFRVV
jgi:Phorbol esters/diacylglycerol binding domain (C1 domain)